MALLQVEYYVPDDIAGGLVTGQLTTLGTAAVRDRTQITAHIRETSRTISDGDGVVGAAIARGLKNPKIVVFGLVVVGVAAAAVAVRRTRRRKLQEQVSPSHAYVVNFNNSLAAYVSAIGSRSIDADLVSRLIADLDAVEENADSETISLELSVKRAAELVRFIADYTSKLAHANSVDLGGLLDSAAGPADGEIVDIRPYLLAQQRILDESA